MLAPGAKLPANAKVVKHKTDKAVISIIAIFFIINPPLLWLIVLFTSFFHGPYDQRSTTNLLKYTNKKSKQKLAVNPIKTLVVMPSKT